MRSEQGNKKRQQRSPTHASPTQFAGSAKKPRQEVADKKNQVQRIARLHYSGPWHDWVGGVVSQEAARSGEEMVASLRHEAYELYAHALATRTQVFEMLLDDSAIRGARRRNVEDLMKNAFGDGTPFARIVRLLDKWMDLPGSHAIGMLSLVLDHPQLAAVWGLVAKYGDFLSDEEKRKCDDILKVTADPFCRQAVERSPAVMSRFFQDVANSKQAAELRAAKSHERTAAVISPTKQRPATKHQPEEEEKKEDPELQSEDEEEMHSEQGGDGSKQRWYWREPIRPKWTRTQRPPAYFMGKTFPVPKAKKLRARISKYRLLHKVGWDAFQFDLQVRRMPTFNDTWKCRANPNSKEFEGASTSQRIVATQAGGHRFQRRDAGARGAARLHVAGRGAGIPAVLSP